MKFLETADRARVLLINDDRLIQKSLYELLARCGYRVDVADSVEDIFDSLDEKTFHIILTDIEESDNITILKL